MKPQKQVRDKFSHRPEIVAEIGTAHGGDLEKARDLIAAAANAGADTAKFQWVIADEILHPAAGKVELPSGSIPLYERFRELERDTRFYAALRTYCEELDIDFLCTAFGSRSVAGLMELGVRRFKVASPELNHLPLLHQLDRRKHRVVLSTGVSLLADIERSVASFAKAELTLLHCITAYPAPEVEYNLSVIQGLSAVFGVPVGVSDHTLDPALVPTLATIMGARVIEKHIRPALAGDGLDDPIALSPRDFARMCARVHTSSDRLATAVSTIDAEIDALKQEFGRERVKEVIGNGVKGLAPSEAKNYGRSNRSLHACVELAAGSPLTRENTALLRTEHFLRPGMPPHQAEQMYGAVLIRKVLAGEGITCEDLVKYSADS